MKVNFLIGMKYSIQMVMMANLAIHITVAPLQTSLRYLTKVLTKSSRVPDKRK